MILPSSPLPAVRTVDGAIGPLSSDVAVGDLDLLFCAVKERLRAIVDEGYAMACVPAMLEPAGHVRVGVLDCVAALDQLHLTLSHELARRQQLERVIGEAQATLARRPRVDRQPGSGARDAPLSTHDILTSLPNGGVSTH